MAPARRLASLDLVTDAEPPGEKPPPKCFEMQHSPWLTSCVEVIGLEIGPAAGREAEAATAGP
jgi:hypothetical protein